MERIISLTTGKVKKKTKQGNPTNLSKPFSPVFHDKSLGEDGVVIPLQLSDPRIHLYSPGGPQRASYVCPPENTA